MFALAPVAIFAIACASGEKMASNDLTDELARDLELASGAGIQLAAGQNAGLQVVSAIEAPAGTSVRRAPAPRPVPRTEPAPVVVPSVGDEPTADPVPAVVEQPAVAVDSAPMPVIAARPTPVQVSFPGSSDGSGIGGTRGGGGVSVVIRGGGTGDDDCELHRTRGRGRAPISINNRFPGAPGVPRGPATRVPRSAPLPTGTFPRP